MRWVLEADMCRQFAPVNLYCSMRNLGQCHQAAMDAYKHPFKMIFSQQFIS